MKMLLNFFVIDFYAGTTRRKFVKTDHICSMSPGILLVHSRLRDNNNVGCCNKINTVLRFNLDDLSILIFTSFISDMLQNMHH